MLKQLLTTTAVVLVLSMPAWAQDTEQAPDSSTIALPPVEAEAGAAVDAEADGDAAEMDADMSADVDAAAAPAEEAPLEDTAAAPEEATAEEATAEEATDAAAARAVPEAVIAAQDESEFRAGELVGMTVVSADGQEVGEVSDLILDDQEKLSGIVVGMGGFLGIGEKLVAIDWGKAELQTDPESDKERIFVGLTATDLEAAPDFMTKEDVQSAAEAEAAAAAAAAAAASQSEMGATPAPATE